MRICAFCVLLLVVAMRPGAGQSPRLRLVVPEATVRPWMTADPDDPAWVSAATTPPMTVSRGDDGKGLAPLPTQVSALWDATHLYLRFRCTASAIYSPFAKSGDPLYQGDVAEVFLDAKGDGREWTELEVSPHNLTLQVLTTLTAAPRSGPTQVLSQTILQRDWWPDPHWQMDGLQTAATIQQRDGTVTGWTVDIALPAAAVLRRVGQSRYTPMTLRANFLRYEYLPTREGTDPRRLLAMNWAPVQYGCPHISPQAMGELQLVTAPR